MEIYSKCFRFNYGIMLFSNVTTPPISRIASILPSSSH